VEITMRPHFEPRLVNDAFGDPGLYVDFRDERRALLFDFGDVSGLPPRKLLRISDVFISHTHVDHFAGFDHWLRVVLGRKEHATLTGGPGFIERVEHKLAAYTWNVVHRYEVPLTLTVREVSPEGANRQATFSSLNRFAREDGEPWMAHGDVLHSEEGFRVRGRFLDHDILCLAFALEEAMHVNVWRNRLAEWGLATGHWLREARRAFAAGAPDDTPISIEWHDRNSEHALTRTLGELRPAFDLVPGRRIGYVTDIRYTEANVQALEELLAGVDLLFIECVFMQSDADHAARKNHLTAQQAGTIARRVGAHAVVPLHFSPRYEGRGAELVAELHAAWQGAATTPAAAAETH
jgi:ribonuclease Z